MDEFSFNPEHLSFRYFRLQGLKKTTGYARYLDEIYHAYLEIYGDEYPHMYSGDVPAPSSDIFLMNDYVDAVYYQNRLAGFVLSRDADISTRLYRQQGWLAAWPDEIVGNLARDHHWATIYNHFTVMPSFRKQKTQGAIFTRTLSEMAAMTFLDRECELLLGGFRLNRGIQFISAHLGGVVLRESFDVNGLNVQLAAFYKAGIREHISNIDPDVVKKTGEGQKYGF